MDLTTFDHILTTTRSVRRRLDLSRPVEPDIIERCLEIAAQAPTGGNRQEWHFMVITDPARRAGVAHRSEAAALLTAYGQSPGDLDFFFYVLEQENG